VAKNTEIYDVHVLASDTIYKGMPWDAVTSWCEQGRISGQDKVRVSGTAIWLLIGEHPKFVDYLFRVKPEDPAELAAQLEEVELEPPPRLKRGEDDDDVDMIPLIDVSLVLLLFFIMKISSATVSPVEVPDMKYAAEVRKNSDAINLQIDKRADGSVFYFMQVGNRAIPAEDNNLTTPEALITRLDAKIAEWPKLIPADQSPVPPEVRIACHKDLPRSKVQQLAKYLDERKANNKIAFFAAEVKEKQQ
jgi:biopolymer transport protein ExbD